MAIGSTAIGLAIVKPIMLFIVMLISAGVITLVKRYAPPWLRKILLHKLW